MVRRTIVPRVQKLKTQNKQKIIGQDGSMHRSCHPRYLQPPSLQAAPVPRGDS